MPNETFSSIILRVFLFEQDRSLWFGRSCTSATANWTAVNSLPPVLLNKYYSNNSNGLCLGWVKRIIFLFKSLVFYPSICSAFSFFTIKLSNFQILKADEPGYWTEITASLSTLWSEKSSSWKNCGIRKHRFTALIVADFAGPVQILYYRSYSPETSHSPSLLLFLPILAIFGNQTNGRAGLALGDLFKKFKNHRLATR